MYCDGALMKSHCRTVQQTTPEIAFVIDRLPRGERGGLQGVFEGIKRIKNIQQILNIWHILAHFEC